MSGHEPTPKPRGRGRRRRRSAWPIAATGLALAAAATTAIGAYLLGGAVAATDPLGREPLVVDTLVAEAVEHYTVSRSYVGGVSPRRRSAVGFELGGRLASLSADDGDTVDAGEPIATLDTRRTEARRAELAAALEQAEAESDLAALIFRRTSDAFDKQAATTRELDEAREAMRSAAAAVATARARVHAVDVDLDKSTLHAPFDAVVAERLIDEGRVVGSGEAVFTLMERVEPEARIGLPPRVAAGVAPGDAFDVVVNGAAYAARVHRVLPVTSTGTRTVEAVLRLDAAFGPIREGDLARVTIPRRVDRGGLWLPMSAMTESTRGLWACYVAEPLADDDRDAPAGATHRLARRPLEVLHAEEDRALVVGTLRPGERVVRDGLHRVVTGQPVRLKPGVESGAAR